MNTQEVVVAAWDKCLELLKGEMSRPTFDSWVKNIRPISLDNGTYSVAVPSAFVKDWLQSRYTGLIRNSIAESLGIEVTVDFRVMQEAEGAHDPREQTFREDISWRPSPMDEFSSTPLNSKYTFDHFVVGASNRFTHAACQAVARNPAKDYNPLFIHGSSGLGKTHLMQALGHEVLSHHSNAQVVYVSGETFLYHVVTSIREDRTSEFRRKYRNVDIWLVDDIQSIAEKERTEVEFFHIFNTLYETNKQIVICSDRPPKDLQLIERRLTSRFECGLITDIKLPDTETRTAILQKMAENDGIDVPEEVIFYIASKVQDNIRVLQGALTKVLAHASLTHSKITLDLAMQTLRDYSSHQPTTKVSIEKIQKALADHFNISLQELLSERRNKGIVVPRQIAMYLASELTTESLPDIGKAFGGRDHSTVIHARDKIKEEIEKDAAFMEQINTIKRVLEN